ncbi:MAG: hypothetical protein EA397_09675 [Deltaproteobacteria bacterium]|nr:MAG: hypothetical protein EA397_09675 [Deltaproteobacteria bacterium]
MASHSSENTDVLRKVAIVMVLLGAMWLLHRFGVTGHELHPTAMLALGFVVLASYTFGEIVGAIKLPHITGYLVAGLVLGGSAASALGWAVAEGPTTLAPWLGETLSGPLLAVLPRGSQLPPPFDEGILNDSVVGQLAIFNTLAVSLIALTAGGELKLESLRRGLKDILAVMGGHFFAVGAMMALFGLAIGGVLGPGLALPFLGTEEAALGKLDPVGMLLLLTVFAIVSIATSPAATVAVITSTRAEGPVTTTSLSAVVLMEVVIVLLFSIFGAIATGWIDPAALVASAGGADLSDEIAGESTGVGRFTLSLVWHVGGSLVFGTLVGFGIAAYLRFVRVEILLFLVSLIFVIAYVGTAAGLDSTLMCIAAGFATTNFSEEGDKLIHEVEKLGLPVYVVFFTLAGASLHLDSLVTLAPFVAGLVLLRGAGVYLGIRGATRMVGSSEPIQRYTWMGFVSQAGIAIALAGLMADRFGDVGVALRDLAIAGVAIHEIIGPVLFKTGLGMAGELPSTTSPKVEEPESLEARSTEPLQIWRPPEGVEDPWPPAPSYAAESLSSLSEDFKAELQSLLQDVESAALSAWVEEARDYLNILRKDFLRHHRHLTVAAQDGRADMAPRIRSETAILADRWRDAVLARASDISQPGWSPLDLVEAIEDAVNRLPETVVVPYEPQTFMGPEEESGWLALLRGAFKLWFKLSSLLGGKPPQRAVQVQLLARYHFVGLVPARLEGLAALLVSADQHLHRRTRSLFHAINHGYDALATLDPPEGQAISQHDELLTQIRQDIEEEFALARDELSAIQHEGVLRTARILGRTYREWIEELPRMNTLDLRGSSRRYSRVFRQRTQGVKLLSRGLGRARQDVSGRFTALALDLELAKLEGRVTDLVAQHGEQLARNVRGKGNTQLARVGSALRDTLVSVADIMERENEAATLARSLRDACTALQHISEDAARSASKLRQLLADDYALGALVDALIAASRDLTERYTVPVGPEPSGEWALPPEVPTADVPLRDVVQVFIETTITQRLAELTRSLASEADTLVATLEDFDRLVAFNLELATGELELIDGEIPESTKELVHDMVLGNLGRSRTRLTEQAELLEGWGERAAEGVKEGVVGELEKLRVQVHDGQISELRLRLVREAAAGRRMMNRAGGLGGVLQAAGDAAGEVLQGALGSEGIRRAESFLGLPDRAIEQRPAPSSFAAAPVPEGLPLVYRRLFSDIAMEAGDLLIGRRAELDRARRVLDGEAGGQLRSVALVGPAGVGKRAIANTLVRKVDTRNVVRIQLTDFATEEEVEQWFQGDAQDRLVVIEGFQWLFSMEPGGMKALRAFTRGLVQDEGKNRWLVQAHTPLWRFANRVAELQDAFAEIVEIQPLPPKALAQALTARHSMSGYTLDFQNRPSLSWKVRSLLQPSNHGVDREREAWFLQIHAATGGLLNDGLQLWMASIAHIDEDRGVIVIGDVPSPPLAALRQLPDDDLLTLRQVTRQGVMTVECQAWLFCSSLVKAEAHLGHLAHLGLLVRVPQGYAVAMHLQGPLARVLAERGWTE